MAQGNGIVKGIVAGAAAVGAAAAAGAGALLAARHRVRKSCRPFYKSAKRQMVIPGLKDGFDPQDLFYVKSADAWLFSGYDIKRKTRDVSPIYRRDADGTVSRLEIKLPNGMVYGGHGAAVCATDKYAFLTVKDGYVVMSLESVLAARDGDVIQAFAHVPVELEPAFMNIQDGILYIGEFYHKRFYDTPKSHWLTCPDGSVNPALMYAYDPSDTADALFGFTARPSRVYSIPAEIQGMCVADGSRVVMSQSWGFGDSQMLVYNPGSAVTDDAAANVVVEPATDAAPDAASEVAGDAAAAAPEHADDAPDAANEQAVDAAAAANEQAVDAAAAAEGAPGDATSPNASADQPTLEAVPTYLVAGEEAPLYYLYEGSLQKTITLPPMSEGIDTCNGQVWLANESASDLYILGKVNAGKYVYSLSV